MKQSRMFLKQWPVVSMVACFPVMPVWASETTFGATGLYNVPSAYVKGTAELGFGYNNALATKSKRTDSTEGENFLATLGAFPNVEINLRLMHIYDKKIHEKHVYGDFYRRDLSGNFKVQLPFVSTDNTKFAVGMTDLGGLAVNFRRYYGVMTHRWEHFDFTLGYSHVGSGNRSDNQNGVLEGGFAGMSYQPFNWLKLSGEYESSATRGGVDLFWHHPFDWAGSLYVKNTLYSSDAQEERHFQLGFSWPLGSSPHSSDWIESVAPTQVPANVDKLASRAPDLRTSRASQVSSEPYQSLNPKQWNQGNQVDSVKQVDAFQLMGSWVVPGIDKVAPGHDGSSSEIQPSQVIPKEDTLKSLNPLIKSWVNALEKAGLDNIYLGFGQGVLTIAYENRLHNWNQLDALGAGLAVMADQALPEGIERLEFLTLKNDQPMLRTQIARRHLHRLQVARGQVSPQRMQAWLDVAFESDFPSRQWLKQGEKEEWVDVTLTLAYRAYYGTEWNNWDYSMALRPVVEVPLWQGAHISSVHHVGTQNSYGFQEGVFAQRALEDEHNELMIHQTLQPFDGFANTLSYGKLNLGGEPYRGLMNQGEQQFFEGYGKVFWRQGSMTSNTLDQTLDYNVVGLEGTWHQADLVAGFHTGRYIEGDRSRVMYAKSMIGNATVSLALTQSDIDWERVDASISFPLGPKKNIALGPVTIGGDPEWRTGLGTVIDNPIAPEYNLIDIYPGYKLVGATLGNSFQLNKKVFDHNRLTPAYIHTHTLKLLQAYRAHNSHRQ